MDETRRNRRDHRSIGAYVASGDYSDYWRTSISRAGEGTILVRGYPIEEVIEQLSHVEVVHLVIRGELPSETDTAVLEAVLKSGVDQQLVSSAACAARYTASASPESVIPALASGVLASGTVTGSPQQCAEMLGSALEAEQSASTVVERWLTYPGYVPGLGHPMHKTVEPRAAALRRLVEKAQGWGPACGLLERIAEALGDQRGGRALPVNLAGMIACVMVDRGWHPLEIGGLGALVYGPALVAHAVEEIREGVPLRIIPDELGSRYTGPGLRHLPARKRASD
ncbi:MAG: citrate/2-methylcitrate synthase [Candidatus Binatia bacterium]